MTALAAALALVPAALTMADDGSDPPQVGTQAVTQVTAVGATLQGKVNPMAHDTTYHFDYGTTTSYGQSTPDESAGNGSSWVSVAKAVEGLTPNTTYHFRVQATDEHGTTLGADKTFTTAADGTSPPEGANSGSGSGTSGSGNGGAGNSGPGAAPPAGDHPSGPSEAPQLGQTVGVQPADGVVRIRKPNDKEYGDVDPDGVVPTGTVIDTRHGKIELTSALPDGTLQTGTFWGGVFEVRQALNGRGYTELVLRGRKPGGCPRRKRGTTASKRRRGASLWGRDRHGRFRTRGHNSVATVRGTTWLTTERCSGTLTFVREGTVVVRVKHGRKVTVRAGHAFLARPRR